MVKIEIIYSFENTSSAILAEEIFIKNKIQISVMPLPSKIKKGCGICLRIKNYNNKIIETNNILLKENNILDFKIYEKFLVNNIFEYKLI